MCGHTRSGRSEAYTAITTVLRKRALEVGNLVPIDMPQPAMTFLQALRKVFWGDTGQRWEPEHLDDDLPNLLRRELSAQFSTLANQRIAGFKQASIATMNDVLECDESTGKRAIGL